jgi:acyl-[acyl carrier protein]--UDP-N-acetylglucosamine O-acyltransferase
VRAKISEFVQEELGFKLADFQRRLLEGWVTADEIRAKTGIASLGYVHDTAVIGAEPESRDFTGAGITPVIDVSARIEALVTVDAGCIRPTRIGARSWLFKHVHIGHDVIVGKDVEISTGAVVGGGAWIGDKARIGINATILPRQVIGEGAIIGAGAVVTKDVPAGETWAGVPAESLQSKREAAARATAAIGDLANMQIGPRVAGDHELRHNVLSVPVAGEVAEELEAGWSRPLHVMIKEGEMIFQEADS